MCSKRKSPYIWVTWLSKVMAGEQACLWASWFKTHHQNFQKAESDFNLARWNLEHTRLLVRTRTDLTARRAEVRVESQNSFQYRHASGAVLAGKPDIVAIEGMELIVNDCKTGKPKMSDQLQVQIYMHVLPVCFPDLALYTIRGRVVYPNHSVEIAPCAVDAGFVDHLDYFIELVGGEDQPFKTPSASECRFCDITAADCPARASQAELQLRRR
jgi:hypothetical protein